MPSFSCEFCGKTISTNMGPGEDATCIFCMHSMTVPDGIAEPAETRRVTSSPARIPPVRRGSTGFVKFLIYVPEQRRSESVCDCSIRHGHHSSKHADGPTGLLMAMAFLGFLIGLFGVAVWLALMSLLWTWPSTFGSLGLTRRLEESATAESRTDVKAARRSK